MQILPRMVFPFPQSRHPHHHRPIWDLVALVCTLKPPVLLQRAELLHRQHHPHRLQALCREAHADRSLSYIDSSLTPPSPELFLSLLSACCRTKCLAQVQHIHAHLVCHGLHLYGLLADYLVVILAKCGSIGDAYQVFASLPCRTVFSWTAMISGYSDCDRACEALRMHQCMQEDGVEPNQHTIVSLLKACGIIMDLKEGRKLHAISGREGFTSDVFVGNSLISMYGKGGSIAEAENVFWGLSNRDIVSWNAMLSVYAEQDQGHNSLLLYRQMRKEGVCPNWQTHVINFQACGVIIESEVELSMEKGCLEIGAEIGQALHADILKEGFCADAVVCSALVSMYGKCGSIVEAEALFNELQEKDVVAWSGMLTVYVVQGYGDRALQLYLQMQWENKAPNNWTYTIALQACALLVDKDCANLGLSIRLAALEIGRALRADVEKSRYGSDAIIGNSLINMYGKCNSIMEAEEVFVGLHQRNVVSWNSLLSAYVEQDHGETALLAYRQMQSECVSPDQQTFAIMVSVCSFLADTELATFIEGQPLKLASLELGHTFHAGSRRKNLPLNVFVGNTLMTMYQKCGALEEAKNVFQGLNHRSTVSWNTMLSVYIEQGQGDKALQLYEHMPRVQVNLNEAAIACVLRACGQTGNSELCSRLHFFMMSNNDGLSLPMANTLIHTYGSCGNIADAQAVFDELLWPDVVTWNAFIAGYARHGDTIAIEAALNEMQCAGVEPDGMTFLSLFTGLSHAGLVQKGLEQYEVMGKFYGLIFEMKHCAVFVDLLGRTGLFERLENVLWGMPLPVDAAIWLCVLGACYLHGNVELGIHAFGHIVHLQPKDAMAYILMSNMYLEAGLEDCSIEVERLRMMECKS